MGGLQRRFWAITTGRVLGSRCWGQMFRDNVSSRLIAVHAPLFQLFLLLQLVGTSSNVLDNLMTFFCLSF